jgi:alcohol dehydrogenase class IV
MTHMNFNFFANPSLYFGAGKLNLFPDLVLKYGKNLLLVLGSASFKASPYWSLLKKELEKKSIKIHMVQITSEPSPGLIDGIVNQHRQKNIDVVAAIGGGSVLDAGKAVSAMMTKTDSVLEFLEGVGTKSHDGKKIKFIAVPTTAGTGSEATKNAVISQLGKNGFKKSLRHDNFIPNIALVDPNLTLGSPSHITGACGMDALTQLLESFVSINSSAITDSLALSGLGLLGDSLIKATLDDPNDIKTRTNLSYASYISGITLANAGLGIVHGFASVIGGKFDIPHGVICGTLVAQATKVTIESLIEEKPESPALQKYAKAFCLLAPSESSDQLDDWDDRNDRNDRNDPLENCQRLITMLTEWTDQVSMSGLGTYGVKLKDINTIVKATGQKNNSIQLPPNKLARILESRL